MALPPHDSSACWTGADRSLELDLPSELPPEEDGGEFLIGYAEGLFAGVFKCSEDASGDRALASLLPGPHQPPVVAQSHGRGQLLGSRSLKSFLVAVALSDEDPEQGAPPGAVGAVELLRLSQVLAAHDGRVAVQAARAEELLARCAWMSRALRNAEPVGLAELLPRAPTIADWDSERAATGGRRLIIRRVPGSVPVTPEIAKNLAKQGWRWSGPTGVAPGEAAACLVLERAGDVTISGISLASAESKDGTLAEARALVRALGTSVKAAPFPVGDVVGNHNGEYALAHAWGSAQSMLLAEKVALDGRELFPAMSPRGRGDVRGCGRDRARHGVSPAPMGLARSDGRVVLER